MCFYAIAKYLLFIFNFVFWCAGAALLGVGIWLMVDTTALADLNDISPDFQIYGAGPIVFVVAGAVMLVFGFFGCCGAIKESTCLLGTYFTMLLIIFGLEVGIGAWAFVSFDSVEEAAYESTYKIFTDTTAYGDGSGADSIQQRFKCCGSNVDASQSTLGCSSYKTLIAAGGPSDGLDSCACDELKDGVCVAVAGNTDISTDCGTTSAANIYIKDCGAELTEFTEDNIQIIGIVGLSIGLAQLIGMFISMCLCCKIKDKDGDI